MNTFIKFFFQHLILIYSIGIFGVLSYIIQINTSKIFMIMYQIIILYLLIKWISLYGCKLKLMPVDNGTG
jgi:hypothetical protein